MKQYIIAAIAGLTLAACGGKDTAGSETTTLSTSLQTNDQIVDAYIKEHGRTAERALMDAMMVEKQFDAMVDVLMPQMVQMSGNNNRATNEKAVKAVAKVFKEEMPALKDDMSKIYGKHLSESELRDAIAFFISPAGKQFAGQTGVIAADSAQVGQDFAMRLMPRLMEEMR